MNENKKRFGRLHLIDEYRGFVLLNMIAYHAIWDLVYMFGVDWAWYKTDAAFYWQQWICWSFILVSGFCWQMSKKPLQRGLLIFAGGTIITLVTVIAMPASKVVFGILTFMGSAMILMIPLDKLLKKIQPAVGAVVSFLIFLFVYPVNNGYFGFGNEVMVTISDEWYADMFSTYLGFTSPGFFSTDYFSILPWMFLYITGYFCYGVVFHRAPKCGIENCPLVIGLQKSICSPLGWIGRKSFIIYMLHQPVVYAVLSIWNWMR